MQAREKLNLSSVALLYCLLTTSCSTTGGKQTLLTPESRSKINKVCLVTGADLGDDYKVRYDPAVNALSTLRQPAARQLLSDSLMELMPQNSKPSIQISQEATSKWHELNADKKMTHEKMVERLKESLQSQGFDAVLFIGSSIFVYRDYSGTIVLKGGMHARLYDLETQQCLFHYDAGTAEGHWVKTLQYHPGVVSGYNDNLSKDDYLEFFKGNVRFHWNLWIRRHLFG